MVIQDGHYKFKGIYQDTRTPSEDEYKEGPCARVFVMLDDKVFLFEEDPSDGYRSYCNEARVYPTDLPKEARFNLETCPVPCYVKNVNDRRGDEDFGDIFRGIIIYTDETCKVELAKFGTDNADDYYPRCIQWLDIPEINRHISEQHLLGE